jgi:hypothetical protein
MLPSCCAAAVPMKYSAAAISSKAVHDVGIVVLKET